MSAQTASDASPRQIAHRRDLIRPLRTAMAPTVMLDRLRQEWPYARRKGLEVTECRHVRVFPRGAKGFVIEYEICLKKNGQEWVQPLTGELVGNEADAWCAKVVRKLGKSKRKQLISKGPTDLVTSLSDLGLVLRCPGLDEEIHGLRLVHDPDLAASVLPGYDDPDGGEIERLDADLLGHRLGKRCIARLRIKTTGGMATESRQASLIAKMYKMRTDRCAQVFEAMEQLRANGFDEESKIRIPRPIAYLSEWQTILMEDVPGTLLPELSGAESVAGTVMAGRAIAKLHRTEIPVTDRHDVDDEIELLEDWVALIGDVYPGLRGRLQDAFVTVQDGLDRCRGAERTLVHRDFYEKQVLVDGSWAFLIDFDTLCYADPALDLGNFIAHQMLAERQGHGASAPRMASAFLDGYRSVCAAPPDESVHAYTKATLLRLACIHSLWLRWTHVVNPLLGMIDGPCSHSH